MLDNRQLSVLLNKNKWMLLIATLVSGIIWLYLRNTPLLDKQFPDDTDSGIYEKSYYDVLLNGYMRGGSSLTGIIFGHRTDSFYLYEPLWKTTRWAYWHGNNSMCRSDRLECINVEPVRVVEDKFVENELGFPAISLVQALDILSKTYDCQFKDFDRTVVVPTMQPKSGGPTWNIMTACMKKKVSYQTCLHRYMPAACKRSTHKVTKVLRVTTDILSSVLQARDNLKVIHLLRDPRAIINSKIETKWYPLYKKNAVIENAKSLCHKMLYDFREGQKVQKIFPDRFRFIYYEDLSVDILNKSKILYNYLDMDINENYYREVMKLSVFQNAAADETERKKNTAFWWRNSLKWEIVENMEEICKDVYKELGYQSFTNVQDYKDISKPSLVIPKQYLIV